MHSEAILLSLATLKKIETFYQKPIYLLTKNPKFCIFWEILLFQPHSTANSLPWAISKKFNIFFEKPIYFAKKNQVFERFQKFFFFLSHSIFPIGELSRFLKISFFPNIHQFCKKKLKFWALWEILLFQSKSTANLLQLDGKTLRQVNERCWPVYTSSNGKNWVVKRTYLSGSFCFSYYWNVAPKIKSINSFR